MTFVRCTKPYSKIQIFLDFHLKKGKYSHKTNAEFILKLHVNAFIRTSSVAPIYSSKHEPVAKVQNLIFWLSIIWVTQVIK